MASNNGKKKPKIKEFELSEKFQEKYGFTRIYTNANNLVLETFRGKLISSKYYDDTRETIDALEEEFMTNANVEIEFTAGLMKSFLTEIARMLKRRLIQDADEQRKSKIKITSQLTVSQALRKDIGHHQVIGQIATLSSVYKMVAAVSLRCSCGNEWTVDYKPKPRVAIPSADKFHCLGCGDNGDVTVLPEWINAMDIQLQDTEKFNNIERLFTRLFDSDTENVRAGESTSGKYAIPARIIGHTSIVGSANPRQGRFMNQNSDTIQLDEILILPQVVDRFDAICVLREGQADEQRDREYVRNKRLVRENQKAGVFEDMMNS